jgi:branched-chain amino acid transport system permease protein
MDNYITSNTHIPGLGFGGTLFGGSFNTIIGIIFLAIVVVSPDGLLGIWGRLFESRSRLPWRRGPAETPEPAA